MVEVCEKHEIFEKTLNDLSRDTKSIKKALLGDYDHQGIVGKVNELYSVKKKLDNAIWKIIGSATAGGGGVVIVWKLIEGLLK